MSEPITREEMYLAKAAGEDVNIPEPITRKEQYLAQIAKNGSGGGSGGGGGLPTPTAEDVGKVMMVQEVPVEYIIVPEQTVSAVEIDDGEVYVLTGYDITNFVAGNEITLQINDVVGTVAVKGEVGEEYAILNTQGGLVYGGIYLADYGDGTKLYGYTVDADPTATIKASYLGTGGYKWGIGVDRLNIHINDATGAMDKTWQEVYDAIKNGVPVYAYSTSSDTHAYCYYITETKISGDEYWIGYMKGNSAVFPWFAPTKDDLLLADDW